MQFKVMDLSDLQAAGMETEEIKKVLDISDWQSGLAYDQWIALPVSGSRPPARYKVIVYLIEILNEPRYIVSSGIKMVEVGLWVWVHV